MRDEKPEMVNETNFNIIVNLHQTNGTHWVSLIRRGCGKVYYVDSFGVETPPLFLKGYVDLVFNERIQEYDESYCDAYCLYMIYLIDRRFTIEGALDILVNQVKCPKMIDKCFCFSCKVKGKVEVNDNQGTCFSDDNIFDNQGACFENCNDNDNQGNCFADEKQESSLSEEDDIVWSKAHDSPTKQRDKTCSQCRCGCGCGGTPSLKVSRLGAPVNRKGNLFINVNGSLQSWITDSNIAVYAPFPENLRCIIAVPSDCGKTV